MEPQPSHVLIVEDSRLDSTLLMRMLESKQRFVTTHASLLSEAEAAARGTHFDVIICDLALPDSTGLTTFSRLRAVAPNSAILVISGTADEELATEAVRQGAQDYLVKGQFDAVELRHSVRYAVERHRLQTALIRSEAFYHSLVETLPQHIIRKDLHERFTFANHHFCQLVGRNLQDIVGKTDFDFFDSALASKYQTDDRYVIQSGQPFETVEVNQAPGGDKRYVNVVKTPIYDAKARIIGIQGIFWDITERKRAEEQLRKAHEDLRRSHEELRSAQLQLIRAAKMESVGTLAAGVAHEVKNPLATLTMGVNYLERNLPKSDANVTVVLKEMREAIGRADKVTRGLLDYSASQQLVVRRENLNEMLEQTLVLLRHKFKEQQIELVTELAGDMPEVAVEKSQIQQVFVNIMMNTLQALGQGGRLVISTARQRLERSRHTEGSRTSEQMFTGDTVVVVAFTDNGPGIPEENLAKIFDPFFTTKPAGVGTGLGLPVSKKIIELHGGTIEVSNQAEGGARVAIILPAEKTL